MTHWPRKFRSALNFAIESKFRDSGIELPFPQRDLHIRSGELPVRYVNKSEEDGTVPAAEANEGMAPPPKIARPRRAEA